VLVGKINGQYLSKAKRFDRYQDAKFMNFKIMYLISLTVCVSQPGVSHADEICAVKVQNNDRFERPVNHLQITPVDRKPADEQAVVNRIILPGHDNVTAIHWDCARHDHAFAIVGLSTTGDQIVVGQIEPATSDIDVEQQPVADLASIDR
jgi:hypothetical protein